MLQSLILQAEAEDLRQELHLVNEAAQSSPGNYAHLKQQLEEAQEQHAQLQEQLHLTQALATQLQQQLLQAQEQPTQPQQELHSESQLECYKLESQLSEATVRNQTTAGESASSKAARSEQQAQGRMLQSQPSARQQQTLKLHQQQSVKRWEERQSADQQLQRQASAEGQPLEEVEDGREAGVVGPIVDKLWNDLQQERVRYALCPHHQSPTFRPPPRSLPPFPPLTFNNPPCTPLPASSSHYHHPYTTPNPCITTLPYITAARCTHTPPTPIHLPAQTACPAPLTCFSNPLSSIPALYNHRCYPRG